MNKEKVKLKCTRMDEEGKGVVKIKGQEIHIPYLIQGETAVVEVFQNKKGIQAKVLDIEEKSEHRTHPKCPHFNQCGGCQLQHLSHEGQAQFKQNTVEKLLKRYHKVNPIITMEDSCSYRNKMHSTLALEKNNKIISGIYEENTHRVISIERCLIQDKHADEIVASILDMMKSFKMKPYDEDAQQGFLRHILVKTGFASNEIMVVLVVSSQIFSGKNNFVRALTKKHPEITTIIMNVNNRRTSMILGDQEKVLYGKGYIEDTLCGYVFQISSKSFYQINPIQTEILYNKAIEMAKFTGNEKVLDAYCGIGTISIIVSGKVKDVIGVELNKEAVKDAIKNAKRNKISNVYFYNDDAGDFMVKLAKGKQSVDTVIMDPPRSGSDEKFLSALIQLSPKQIIYISCNPVTLDRDLKFLTQKSYVVKEIQPVDMFPETYHTESCVKIERLKG